MKNLKKVMMAGFIVMGCASLMFAATDSPEDYIASGEEAAKELSESSSETQQSVSQEEFDRRKKVIKKSLPHYMRYKYIKWMHGDDKARDYINSVYKEVEKTLSILEEVDKRGTGFLH